MTFTPQKKNPGDVLQSSDWNAAMEEIAKLDDTKVNRSGQEKMSGSLAIGESLTIGEMGRSGSHLTVSGNVGIGTSEPKARLDVAGTLKLQEGVAVKKFSADGLGNSDSSVPTETAVKTYVDQINQALTTALSQKAALAGSSAQNFQVNHLTTKGNSGIGTDAPRSQLEIQRDASGQLGPVLTLTNSSGSSGAGAAIDFNGYAVPKDKPSLRLQSLDDGRASSHFTLLSKQSGSSANDLVERLRVTSEGNVGIGTASPTEKLEVNGKVKATTVTADKLIGEGAVVTGMIVMWSGTTNNIPKGWALCDGSNGTPDLRGRFVLGGGQGRDLTNRTIGEIGGKERHQLTVQEMPAHSHSITDRGHSHNWSASRQQAGTDDNNNTSELSRGDRGTADTMWKDTSGSYTGISINNEGGNATHENMPPFYVLAYIMKL